MITKIVECGNIRSFNFPVVCASEKDPKLQFYATMSTHKADTIYTPGHALCCWSGIIQEKKTDLGYVHIVPDRFLLWQSVNKN